MVVSSLIVESFDRDDDAFLDDVVGPEFDNREGPTSLPVSVNVGFRAIAG
jgi:hypothetical protein